ncbi:MAG: cell division ATP-binding protein FtsE [Armatimonadetes bacterium]|nr:cell division ATP-binding protein FtsE [Armatimonadota bacterium]
MIELVNVSLVYKNGIKALDKINLSIEKGEFIFLVGPTSSGKSSILRLIYRDIIPTEGEIYVENQEISELKNNQVPYLRRRLGIIFQDFKLLPHKNVYENVAYSLEVTGAKHYEIKRKTLRTLNLVGLSERYRLFPQELYGGEMQRTAIARALVNEPLILLADEPTGNLDPYSSWEIIKLLEKINQRGTTVIMATHDKDIVDYMKKRVIVMSGGLIIKDQIKGSYHISEVKSV